MPDKLKYSLTFPCMLGKLVSLFEKNDLQNEVKISDFMHKALYETRLCPTLLIFFLDTPCTFLLLDHYAPSTIANVTSLNYFIKNRKVTWVAQSIKRSSLGLAQIMIFQLWDQALCQARDQRGICLSLSFPLCSFPCSINLIN